MAQTRLKQLREEAVLTVHELAEASGVSDDTISKIENGQRVARPSTLRKLAGALDVSPQELRRPAKVEEPVPLDEAPREAGPPEERSIEAPSPSEVATAAEEERHVIPQSAATLKKYVEEMTELKKLREAEMKDLGKGVGLRDALLNQMDLADKGLHDLMKELGVLDFAKAVRAGREMAEPEAIPLCHELLRRLEELEKVSAEARVASGVAEAGISVEGVKGPAEVEAWMHKQSPES
jgi:transcriptional regulator with XRE-family HTH domain